MSTKRPYLSKVVVEMPDSGIKDFRYCQYHGRGSVSGRRGAGLPDAGACQGRRRSLPSGAPETKYTDNRVTVVCAVRQRRVSGKFDLHYDRADEILITMGASEGIDLALRALVDQETRFWWLSLPYEAIRNSDLVSPDPPAHAAPDQSLLAPLCDEDLIRPVIVQDRTFPDTPRRH